MGKLHSQEVPFWKILAFYGYIQIWWEIWQYLWPDLGTLSRLLICSTSGWNSSFGDCRRMSEPGVVKGFEQPFTITKIRNWTKKRPLRVKPSSGQKKMPYSFPGIYCGLPSWKQTSFDTVFRSMSFWGGDPATLVFVGFYNPIIPSNKIQKFHHQKLKLTHPVA